MCSLVAGKARMHDFDDKQDGKWMVKEIDTCLPAKSAG